MQLDCFAESWLISRMREVTICLDEPPEVVNAGFAIHGLNGPDGPFRLPDLWQFHLYEYEADLEVDGSAHRIKPGRVSLIPAGTDVEYHHLTKLVKEATGSTLVAYIRHRRMMRAEHLLRESTLSIPAIAASVGIPDLQTFNKACHREFGASPRTVRGRARH